MPKTYGQFCPVALACEILAERWTPLVIRELLAGSRRFSEIQRGVPRMSPALLTKRLETLVDVGIVERREIDDGAYHEYCLEPAGEQLRPIIEQIGEWGKRWVRGDVKEEHLDPRLLMWDIRRGVAPQELPAQRVVAKFQFWDCPSEERMYWLIIDGQDVDLCLKPPGFDVDVTIDTDLETMVAIWLGDIEVATATESGDLDIDGPRSLVLSFPDWLSTSPFA